MEGKKRERKRRSLFYVFKRLSTYRIYKLDLNRDFVPANADINYLGRRKKKKKKRSVAGHQRPPCMPSPYLSFKSFREDGELPEDMALAALGSKIYLLGGNFSSDHLPRQVYVIDTAEEHPEIRKSSSCLLNWGKREPIAWTIRGNIYIMPATFSEIEFYQGCSLHPMVSGKFFECYNPESNSWTILPSPPLEGLGCADPKLDPLLVQSHAVLGSTLVISLATGSIFAFDTARTDLAWKKIRLKVRVELGPRRRLNFLPFHPCHSSPAGDNLVLCYPREVFWQCDHDHVKEEVVVDFDADYYVCRFDGIGASGSLKASILPFNGSSMEMRWERFFTSHMSNRVTWLRDDLVLFAKVGHDFDYDRWLEEETLVPQRDMGDGYLSFEVFRVDQSADQFQASSVSSALLKALDDELPYFEPFCCFVMEDGL